MGKVRFKEPVWEPRIHAGAPPHVLVTQLEAWEDSARDSPPTYSIYSGADHQFFAVNSTSGELRTKEPITRPVNSTYFVIVIAYCNGQSEIQQLRISVTEFNRNLPRFLQDIYRIEVPISLGVGEALTQLEATDGDPQPYNRELRYFLEPVVSGEPDVLSVDVVTGRVSLARRFAAGHPRIQRWNAIVRDGGSPLRKGVAFLELIVKMIS
ncbi:unnamed protein product, partial [Darwinula stevensoni]